jgi:hypothetical protein
VARPDRALWSAQEISIANPKKLGVLLFIQEHEDLGKGWLHWVQSQWRTHNIKESKTIIDEQDTDDQNVGGYFWMLSNFLLPIELQAVYNIYERRVRFQMNGTQLSSGVIFLQMQQNSNHHFCLAITKQWTSTLDIYDWYLILVCPQCRHAVVPKVMTSSYPAWQ